MIDPWLPAGFAPKHVYGLIADTHMPMRLRNWPESLARVFADVDMILHAGDVGELWVLDQLSRHAPVVAVHGNDDSQDAKDELPNQFVINVAGIRILLWHGHYPDRIDEMASRVDQTMGPKLNRLAERGRRAGAKVVVMGHWHIPFLHQTDDVLVVNPGALGTGNAVSQLIYSTVARLYVAENGDVAVVHVDVKQPDQPHTVLFNAEADFIENLAQYNRSIMSPQLQPYRADFFQKIWPVAKPPIHDIALKLAWQVWDGDKEMIELADWYREVTANEDLTDAQRAEVLSILDSFK